MAARGLDEASALRLDALGGKASFLVVWREWMSDYGIIF